MQGTLCRICQGLHKLGQRPVDGSGDTDRFALPDHGAVDVVDFREGDALHVLKHGHLVGGVVAAVGLYPLHGFGEGRTTPLASATDTASRTTALSSSLASGRSTNCPFLTRRSAASGLIAQLAMSFVQSS